MSRVVCVIGAGGHAKVVISTLQACGQEVSRVLDDDSAKWGTKVLGLTIFGPVTEAAAGEAAIAAVGDNRVRARLVESLELDWMTAVHPSAIVHASVSIGPGSLVCAGAVIQPGARIGAHAIVNTSASVDHDCELGDFVHIAPGARLAGDVRIGTGALLGIGAVAVPGVSVGEWVSVGAGAALTGDVPAGCTAVGVPARIREAST